MRIILLMLGAFAIDAVFAPAFTDAFRLYTGFAAVLFVAHRSSGSSALWAALFYGLMLDILNPSVPFGTFMAALWAAWAAILLGRSLITRLDSKRTLLVVFVFMFGYALGIEFAVFLSMALFSALPATLATALAKEALASALATAAVCAAVMLSARFLSARAHTWLLIHESRGARKA